MTFHKLQHTFFHMPITCNSKQLYKQHGSFINKCVSSLGSVYLHPAFPPALAPQVIRKIRGELFSDALGHLKLWCQFFNVLGDSTIKWFKDDEEIAEITRR